MPDLVFSGRPAGRPVYAPLCGRAAPPPGVSPARGPRLAAPLLGPVGPARFSGSPSSSTVAVASFTPLRLRAAPPPGHCPARGPHLAAPRRRRRAPARRPARGPFTSLPGPGGLGSHFSTPLFALAAGWAAAMPSMLARDHRKGGGTCAAPPVTSAR